MKKFLLFLGIFMLMCPTTYASEKCFQIEEHEDIPKEVIDAANLIGEQYDINPKLLEAIAYHESRYISNINNGHGCYGLMQIHLSSHRSRLQKLNIDEKDIYDTYSNMLIAADLLSELFEKYDDPNIVLAVYHGEKITSKPSKYVRNILDYVSELEEQYEY